MKIIFFYHCAECDAFVCTDEELDSDEVLPALSPCCAAHFDGKEYHCTCLVIPAIYGWTQTNELAICDHACEIHGFDAQHFGPAS